MGWPRRFAHHGSAVGAPCGHQLPHPGGCRSQDVLLRRRPEGRSVPGVRRRDQGTELRPQGHGIRRQWGDQGAPRSSLCRSGAHGCSRGLHGCRRLQAHERHREGHLAEEQPPRVGQAHRQAREDAGKVRRQAHHEQGIVRDLALQEGRQRHGCTVRPRGVSEPEGGAYGVGDWQVGIHPQLRPPASVGDSRFAAIHPSDVDHDAGDFHARWAR